MSFASALSILRPTLPYYLALTKYDLLHIDRDSFEFRPHPAAPPIALEMARTVFTMGASSCIESFVMSRTLAEGPKVFAFDALTCEALENFDLNVPTADYLQPFPSVVIELPPDYTKRRIVPFDAGTHAPDFVIVRHEPEAGCVMVTMHLTATVDPVALAEIRDAILRDRLLSFERGFEDLMLPSDEEVERARVRLEELDEESDEYLETLNHYNRLADRKLAEAFLSSVHPTLSPGVQRFRAELVEAIQSLLAECRRCDTWDDRSEYKLPSWLEGVEEGMIPYTSLPKLRQIKLNLEELLARHRRPRAE